MATLDDIVTVQIQLNTTGIGRANFGTVLVLAQKVDGTHAGGTVETYRRYSDIPQTVPALARATARAVLSQTPRADRIKIGYVADVNAIKEADMNAILDSDSAWYAIVVGGAAQNQQELARWTETQRRLLLLSASDSQAEALSKSYKDQNLFRTCVVAGGDNVAAALAGRALSYPAGSETWALKKLAGTTVAGLSATVQEKVLANNATVYARVSGDLNVTLGGKVAGGEWIDVIRFRDWLQDAMQTNLVAMMINRPKLPYTDEGLAVIANTMIATLQEGVRAGGIIGEMKDDEGNQVPGYTVTVPRAKDVPFNIKASRVAHVGFEAYLTGAIHAIRVEGSFTYEGSA